MASEPFGAIFALSLNDPGGDDLGRGAIRFLATRPPENGIKDLPDGTPHHLDAET